MKKSKVIIIALGGLLSFAGSFGLTWSLKGSPQVPQQAQASQADLPSIPDGLVSPGAGEENLSRSMTEKHLRNLIYDLREQMTQYNKKQKELDAYEQRLQTTRELLEQDIEKLENLRVQAADGLSKLKARQALLEETMVQIAEAEKANIQRIASTYDKMDATQASKIVINMSNNNQLGDAVKIIHYMTERTAAKLIGEIGGSKPEIATIISLQLKKIKESN